ncbi:MAG TPA: hypothetical protein VM734_32260, partial [Kofleriaceae bacterium]|nr:hypothetical protein [Kofleriaceae bacterium]
MAPPMTIRPSLLAALPLALLAAVAVDAAADRRAFTHTYEYLTIADGETELQLYSDQRRTTFGDDAVETFGLRLELGHGITERWEVALRHGFEQTSGPAVTDVVRLHLTDVELRTRYRFADRGDGPLDLAVQARAAKLFGDSVYVLEGEVILALDLGLATIAVQPIVRVAVGSDVAGTDVELVDHPAPGLGAELPRRRCLVGDAGRPAELDVGAGDVAADRDAHDRL